ncbi:MAG: hypothetical protein AAFU61_09350 [Pseudomonadota bacterium]
MSGLDAEDLRAAVAAGIVDDAQAARLSAFAERRATGAAAMGPTEERFELVRGLNDVLVTFGALILLVACAGFVAVAASFEDLGMETRWLLLGASLLPIAWVLSKGLVRGRRLVLPGILFCVVIAGCGWLVATASVRLLAPGAPDATDLIAGFAGAATASAAFCRRFRLPFSLFVIAVASFPALAHVVASPNMVAVFLTWEAVEVDVRPFITGANGLNRDELQQSVREACFHLSALTFGFGIVCLMLAARCDMQDPLRLGRRSADGFWLHAAAGPALAAGLLRDHGLASSAGSPGPGIILLAGAAFLLIAIVLDRRSLLLTAMVFVVMNVFGAALPDDESGLVGAGPGLAVLAGLGAGIVGLGLAWAVLRRRLLHALPGDVWKRRVPPAG